MGRCFREQGVRVEMIFRYRKAISLLLLGGYSLVVSVSGAFHTHSASGGSVTKHDSAAPCCSHACHGNSDHVPHLPASAESDSSAPHGLITSAEPHCPICSFLAQKLIPPAFETHEDSRELEQPLVRVRALPPLDDTPSTVFGRAPPSTA